MLHYLYIIGFFAHEVFACREDRRPCPDSMLVEERKECERLLKIKLLKALTPVWLIIYCMVCYLFYEIIRSIREYFLYKYRQPTPRLNVSDDEAIEDWRRVKGVCSTMPTSELEQDGAFRYYMASRTRLDNWAAVKEKRAREEARWEEKWEIKHARRKARATESWMKFRDYWKHEEKDDLIEWGGVDLASADLTGGGEKSGLCQNEIQDFNAPNMEKH